MHQDNLHKVVNTMFFLLSLTIFFLYQNNTNAKVTCPKPWPAVLHGSRGISQLVVTYACPFTTPPTCPHPRQFADDKPYLYFFEKYS